MTGIKGISTDLFSGGFNPGSRNPHQPRTPASRTGDAGDFQEALRRAQEKIDQQAGTETRKPEKPAGFPGP